MSTLVKILRAVFDSVWVSALDRWSEDYQEWRLLGCRGEAPTLRSMAATERADRLEFTS